MGGTLKKTFSKKYFFPLFLCTLAKSCNMYFSFLSMRHTSIPVYNVLKRMNPICGLLLDTLIRNRSYPLQARLGMVCLFVGAVITGSGDLDFHPIGYGCALLAVCGQSSYLVLAARAQDNLPELSHVEVLFFTGFYNQLLFFPLMVPELGGIQDFYLNTEWSGLGLAAVFILYVCQGMILNYVTFWCTSATSPVTTGVSGNVKGAATTVFAVLLHNVRLAPHGWAGVVLNSVGGVLYALSKKPTKAKAN